MKTPTRRFWVVGLPLFSLLIATTTVAQQYARCSRYSRELKQADSEYHRLSRTLPKIPTGVSATFAESRPHTHSAGEEDEDHMDQHADPPAPEAYIQK